MPILKPGETANAANAIYSILTPNQILHEAFPETLNDNFDLSGGKKLTGKSGGKILQSTTGFALAAPGKSTVFQDDAFLVIRGTKKLADVVTDLDATWVKPNGTRVHSGFNAVFESLKPQLEEFFIGYHPTCVHIVGHSLGGAIGTLVAEWIKTKGKATEVQLYTFGCPRVGLSRYADVFTELVNAGNVYRVFNPTDIIPMVPTFPYVHVPLPGTHSYPNHHNTIWTPVSMTAHLMRNYMSGVRGQTWETLSKPQSPADFDNQVQYWLATQNWASMSVHGIKMIYSALAFILKKILLETGKVFDAAATATSNLLDMMAMYLERGARSVKAVGGYVAALMRNILKALGLIVTVPKDLTASFIHWVFRKLSATLNHMAKMAIRGTFI